MEIKIPRNCAEWYGREVLACRGPDKSLFVIKHEGIEPMMETALHNAQALKTPLSREQLNDLHLQAFRPTQAKIGPAGELQIPDDIGEWLDQEGVWHFLKDSSKIEITRGWRRCLCDDPTCSKCLLGNCEDPRCKIHTPKRKERRLSLQRLP